MEYYPKYTPELSTQEGAICFQNGDYYLNETNDKVEESKPKSKPIIIINNRAINGDIVLVSDNKVVGIKQRLKEHIVGILHLNLNQKYGFTKRGVPIIKFMPLSNKYPTFMVPSKSRARIAQLCIISFNKWDTTQKHPTGQIEQIIGPVGEFNNETQAILYKNHMCPLEKSQQRKPHHILSDEQILKHPWIKSNGNNDVEYNTISIDPEGCKDIDDALHAKHLDDNIVEIGIHIADVASRLDLEKLKFKFFSSIYFDGEKQENMLNDNFTFNTASLGNDEVKRAVSLIIKFKTNFKENIAIINSFIFKSTIVKNRALSYSEADTLISKEYNKGDTQNTENYTQKSLKLLNKLANILINGSTKQDNTINHIPATKMVEHFMLMYNSISAETLYNFNSNTILRSHQKAPKNLINTNTDTDIYTDTCPSELTKFIERISQNAAKYVIDYKGDKESIIHESLEFAYYTHSTSPIRRYVDIINQINLLRYISCLTPFNISQEQVDSINIFNKNLRKFYNNYKKLKIIFNSEINNKEFSAYIIQIKTNKIKVYIPTLDIEHNCQILSHKLNSLDRIRYSEDLQNDSYNSIYVDDIKLSLYDNIKISITTLPKELFFNKKLYCKIIEPEISVF